MKQKTKKCTECKGKGCWNCTGTGINPITPQQKPKELDWGYEKAKKDAKELADRIDIFNPQSNRCCPICGNRPEYVVEYINMLLTQQRTELLEEILGLEILKEEPDTNDYQGGKNYVRENVKEDITNLLNKNV